MKCGACKYDDDNEREENGFIRIMLSGGESHQFVGAFPQHESSSVKEQVLGFACPKCGTLRIDSWRLKDL